MILENYDILECKKSKTVWLYLGNKYYCLSKTEGESRARSSIARKFGSPIKVGSLYGIGDQILEHGFEDKEEEGKRISLTLPATTSAIATTLYYTPSTGAFTTK